MDENEAIKLLDKLKNFMETTNNNIEFIAKRLDEIQIDVNMLKADKKRIIVN